MLSRRLISKKKRNGGSRDPNARINLTLSNYSNFRTGLFCYYDPPQAVAFSAISRLCKSSIESCVFKVYEVIQRKIKYKLLEALSDSPVVLIHGARQTSKSTLVKELSGNEFPAKYLTFDDTGILSVLKTILRILSRVIRIILLSMKFRGCRKFFPQ